MARDATFAARGPFVARFQRRAACGPLELIEFVHNVARRGRGWPTAGLIGIIDGIAEWWHLPVSEDNHWLILLP